MKINLFLIDAFEQILLLFLATLSDEQTKKRIAKVK